MVASWKTNLDRNVFAGHLAMLVLIATLDQGNVTTTGI